MDDAEIALEIRDLQRLMVEITARCTTLYRAGRVQVHFMMSQPNIVDPKGEYKLVMFGATKLLFNQDDPNDVKAG